MIHDELTAAPISTPSQFALQPPDPASAAIVMPAAGAGGQHWIGSPSALIADGDIYLAYRLREPGRRGYAVEVARSADGVRFQTLVTITKEQTDCESLERPALAITDDGTWRLYLSCATHDTKHWRVELIEAAAPDAFDPASRGIVLPGDRVSAVKDPVVVRHGGLWHLWASVHPLDDPAHTDRMTTGYATSADGISWVWQGTALRPTPGSWDSRGVRVAAVRFEAGRVNAYYDGRASAAQNCEELTGIATGAAPGDLTAVPHGPVARSAYAGQGLRYVSLVGLPDGRERLYYELTNARGSHDLVTELR